MEFWSWCFSLDRGHNACIGSQSHWIPITSFHLRMSGNNEAQSNRPEHGLYAGTIWGVFLNPDAHTIPQTSYLRISGCGDPGISLSPCLQVTPMTENTCLEQQFSKGGPWTSSTSIPWEFVRNAHLWTYPPAELGTWGGLSRDSDASRPSRTPGMEESTGFQS